MTTTKRKNPFIQQAEKLWDLKRLYTDLAAANGQKELTFMEKVHLQGLLCGYSPDEIADKLVKDPDGVRSELCRTVYFYTKKLLGKEDQELDNWSSISRWLEQAGYKVQALSSVQQEEGEVILPLEALDGVVKITNNINFQNFKVEIHVRGLTSISRETLKKMILESEEK
ncbi:MAG: hypothetical protein BWK78_06750 [Thiotrichaceae bacterium IS1]|nr:MAG: hypothetical protein BWK78_06750 [Thiotrichaceae bacterium IS1]